MARFSIIGISALALAAFTTVGCNAGGSADVSPMSADEAGAYVESVSSGWVCGDVNGNGFVDYGDLLALMNYVFKNGPAPKPLQAADVNCDGSVNVADVRYLAQYIFDGGPAPCENCRWGDDTPNDEIP